MFSSLPFLNNISIKEKLQVNPFLNEGNNLDYDLPPSPKNINYLPESEIESFSLLPELPPFRSLTEICGSPGIGKTQFMMFLCAKVICDRITILKSSERDYHEGLNYTIEDNFNILYVDTEGSFSLMRFRSLLINLLEKMFPQIPITSSLLQDIGNRIKLQRVMDLDQHLITLNNLERTIQEEQAKIVIYDSIAFFYRMEMTSFEWQQLILEHGQTLCRVCDSQKVCIIVVNQVTTKFDKERKPYLAPALGNTWNHMIPHRIFLYMSEGKRKLGIWKSNESPIKEYEYTIEEHGIILYT